MAARFELLEAGVGRRAIEHRIGSGRYLRPYDGVYAIGHKELTVYGRRRAIVLACGRRAVLSHRSGTTRTRSDVEAAFLQLCLDHGLPRPQVNRTENGAEQDFRFPGHNLIDLT